MNPDPPSIIVSGDIVLDRHIYEGERGNLQDQSPRGTHLVEEIGGAAITQRLLAAIFDADYREQHGRWKESAALAKKSGAKATAEPQRAICVLGCQPPSARAWPDRLIGYASWAPQAKPGSKDQVWRVSRAFGYGPPEDLLAGPVNKGAVVVQPLLPANNLPTKPTITVLDDAGDRFRLKENSAVWFPPTSARTPATLPRWIVLKLAGSIGQGELWDHLLRCQPRRRLVISISARLLRSRDVRLSRGLSWERTVEHFMSELEGNPELRPLREARHLIVNFDHDGALWIDQTNANTPAARLVYDAENAEGEWASNIEGNAFGYLTCLTAAVAHHLANTDESRLDLQQAIERGLSAMRNLRADGHGVAVNELGVFQPGQGFPAARIANEILHPTHRFVRTDVPLAGKTSTEPWSILASLQSAPVSPRPLFGFARQLAVQGQRALDHVPHFRVGSLLTASREEMETLRSLRRILIAYRKYGSAKRPLSIGVFGAPGAGKSFGVQQLAIGIFGGPGAKSYEGWMEFNLSQFDSPTDLIGAFHQVRDRVLHGFVPVVFWDEFDSREYKWLQFLLAPMQDGRFQEGQITHPLGRCVFVFAGGTSWSFEEFGPAADAAEEVKNRFRLAKGPDFKSRLDGFLNVLGPNPRTLPSVKGQPPIADPADIFYPVRRALMLRNILGCKGTEKLEMDSGLLTALLEAERYNHGARSLSKVLEPLAAARKQSREPLRRSQLPAPNQLADHVDSLAFHKLCARDLPFKTSENIEKLAPAIHETWLELEHKQPRTRGGQTAAIKSFAELPSRIRRSNRAAALRIPDVLALVGLKMTPGVATKAEENRARQHIARHLEALAEEEHNGWMAHMHSEGWQFAETRNDEKRLHPCLRPFHELSEQDKDRDRTSVVHYPDFAKRGGFKIVFI